MVEKSHITEGGNGSQVAVAHYPDRTIHSLRQEPLQTFSYSPMILKSYNKERHLEISQAYDLLRANDLSEDKLISAINGKQIRVYRFKEKDYLDRLDMGRVFHQKPTRREGLHIERYFSDGKSSPLDAVKYEKRDLKIEDVEGQVIFRMEDASFPESWINNDAAIVAQKYFFKPNKDEWKSKLKEKIGYEHENSLRHLIERVSNFFADEGEKIGYFRTQGEKRAFADELKALQIERKFAFNSPVQFNAGIFNEYGIQGSPGMNYWKDLETGEVLKIEEGCNINPQCHACFIKGPSDNLESILQHFVHEGGIFASGSGIGYNVGAMRGGGEPLSGGGKSSGSMSFLGVHDYSAGSIKSGGKSRRAARMAVMDQDHPDIMEFIHGKVREDLKALILMESGFTPGMDGEAYTTVKYQNTNLSVRLDNHFFEQLEKNGEIELRRVVDGKVVDKISTDRMLKEISFAAWRIGDPGVQYESKIQEYHTSKNSGRIRATNPCSEYVFLDDTSCNLASLNLAAFADQKGNFDVESFIKASRIVSIALDIANDAASYPVEEIAAISPEFRTIGLGYANLGTLLMRKGLAYDSDKGRATAAAITALMNGIAYETSTELAEKLGTFTHFEFNKKPFLEVMRKHQINLEDVIWEHIDPKMKEAAYASWDNVVKRGTAYGFRNAQATVLAPTGTISFLMGCDTTGVEPPVSLVIGKDLAGGGRITLFNREVTNALDNLEYKPQQIEDILGFIEKENTVVGSPHMNPEHYPIFATAFGNKESIGSIPFEGHLKMLAATQPFISGAISKTNNMPESATVKNMYDGFILGHKLGLKALAVFRNESKPSSALNFGQRNFARLKRGQKEDLPSRREGYETEVELRTKTGPVPLHIIVSEYEDGRPGQIAFFSYTSGSSIKALLEISGIQASKALKRGVHLEDVINAWRGQTFEPRGFVSGHPYIKQALSPLDFAHKFLKLEYLGDTDISNTGDDDANEEESESHKVEIDLKNLRGAQNGAFRTYERLKINAWDIDQVIKDSELGGFAKKEDAEERTSVTTKPKKMNNDRGVTCNGCGNLMLQISPNCFTCSNCGDKRGGCGM